MAAAARCWRRERFGPLHGKALHALYGYDRRSVMSSMRVLCTIVICGSIALLPTTVCQAATGTVQVKSLNDSGRVEVEAKDASIDDILAQLGTAQDIKIERIGDETAARAWSGRISGSVDAVVARLLESENFVVEHARGTRSGILRIRVFAATETDVLEVTQSPSPQTGGLRGAVQPAPPAAPATARQQQPQTAPPPPSATAQPRATPSPATGRSAQTTRPKTRSNQAGAQRRGGVVQ